jgi:hypothetical protein
MESNQLQKNMECKVIVVERVTISIPGYKNYCLLRLTSYSLVDRYQCFIGTCCLHLHGKRVNHAEINGKENNELAQESINGSSVKLMGSYGHEDSSICGQEEARLKLEAASSSETLIISMPGLYGIIYQKTATFTGTDTRTSTGTFMIN